MGGPPKVYPQGFQVFRESAVGFSAKSPGATPIAELAGKNSRFGFPDYTPKAPCSYIVYIFRAQRGSLILTLGPKYISYSYMEPFGTDLSLFRRKLLSGSESQI